MKRNEFLRHLRYWGCFLKREGMEHSIYFNIKTGKSQSVPRHTEIDNNLVKKICKVLEIPNP